MVITNLTKGNTMKITVSGWGRRMGEKKLVYADLRDAKVRNKVYPLKSTETVIERHERPLKNGGLAVSGASIHLHTESLSLNGNYQLTLKLSKQDITKLFYEQFKDHELEMLLKQLDLTRNKKKK